MPLLLNILFTPEVTSDKGVFVLLMKELGRVAKYWGDKFGFAQEGLINKCIDKLKEIQDKEDKTWRATLFALQALCYVDISFEELIPALEIFLQLLDNCPSDCLQYVCSGLCHITFSDAERCVHYFIPDKSLKTLMRLGQKRTYYQGEVFEIFANLSTDPAIIDALLALDVLNIIAKVFKHGDHRLQRSAAQLLVNITAGTTEQTEAVIFHKELMEIFLPLADSWLNMFADLLATMLFNATCASQSTIIGKLVEIGCIECFCILLGKKIAEVNELCLAGLSNILQDGERLVNEEIFFNPYALRFADCGGLELLNDVAEDFVDDVDNIHSFFGEKYEVFLARKRGLLTKSARS